MICARRITHGDQSHALTRASGTCDGLILPTTILRVLVNGLLDEALVLGSCTCGRQILIYMCIYVYVYIYIYIYIYIILYYIVSVIHI